MFKLIPVATLLFLSPTVLIPSTLAQDVYRDNSGAFVILFTKDKTAMFEVHRNGVHVEVKPNPGQSILSVKGLTDRHLGSMGMDLDTFKKALKKQTGYKTVFLVP